MASGARGDGVDQNHSSPHPFSTKLQEARAPLALSVAKPPAPPRRSDRRGDLRRRPSASRRDPRARKKKPPSNWKIRAPECAARTSSPFPAKSRRRRRTPHTVNLRSILSPGSTSAPPSSYSPHPLRLPLSPMAPPRRALRAAHGSPSPARHRPPPPPPQVPVSSLGSPVAHARTILLPFPLRRCRPFFLPGSGRQT